jgi:hypothetical protein
MCVSPRQHNLIAMCVSSRQHNLIAMCVSPRQHNLIAMCVSPPQHNLTSNLKTNYSLCSKTRTGAKTIPCINF